MIQTQNMTTLENLVEKILELKENHKQFKNINKDVFTEHRKYNKNIKEKEKELIQKLKEQNMIYYEYKGMEFKLKDKSNEKHNLEQLAELIDNEEKFHEYINSIKIITPLITTRRTKRRRVDELNPNS